MDTNNKKISTIDFSMLVLPGFVISILVGFMMSTGSWTGLLSGKLVDTDSYMHVLRMFKMLENPDASWGEIMFADRDNAPYGFYMHWTILFDALVFSIAKILMLFISDERHAIIMTAGFFSLISVGLLSAVSAWTVLAVTNRTGAIITSLLIALSMPIQAYGIIGRADHHVFAVTVSALFIGFVLRVMNCRGDDSVAKALLLSALCGLSSGLAVWSTVETLPVVLFGYCLLLANIVLNHGGLRAISGANTAFFGFISVAVFALIDPVLPWSKLGSVSEALDYSYDRLSLVFVMIFAVIYLCFMSVLKAGKNPHRGAFGLAVWSVIPAIFGTGILMIITPGIFQGAGSILDQELIDIWWNGIKELQPVRNLSQLCIYLGSGILAIIVLIRMLIKDSGQARKGHWSLWLVLVVGFTALTFRHIRFSPYLSAFAIIVLGIYAGRLTAYYREVKGPIITVYAVAVAMAIFPLGAGAYFKDKSQPVEVSTGEDVRAKSVCEIQDVAHFLDNEKFMRSSDPIILSEISEAPEILFATTSVRTIAGPYQRNVSGLRAFYQSMRSEKEAIKHASERGIDFYLLCPEGIALHDGMDFARKLMKGDTPEWLNPVRWPRYVNSDLKLFKIEERKLALKANGGDD